MGTMFYGPTKVDALLNAIKNCLDDWEDDPAYNAASQKLREVQYELDALTQSPAARQAARVASPNQTGHPPQSTL